MGYTPYDSVYFRYHVNIKKIYIPKLNHFEEELKNDIN